MPINAVTNNDRYIDFQRSQLEPLKEKKENKSDDPGILKNIKSSFKRVYNDTKDASVIIGLINESTDIAEQFTSIPSVFSDIFRWAKPLKIVKGILNIGKLYSNTKKFFVEDSASGKISATWGMYKSLSSITKAVSTTMGFLKDFGVIASEALKWTAVTDYVFLPVKVISTGISSFNLGQKIGLYTTFKENTKCPKQDAAGKRIAKMINAMTYVQKEEKSLLDMKVITKDCPLKERTDSIIERLQASNKEMRVKAALEGKVMIRNLKDRISAQVVSNAIDTTLRTVGLTTFFLGFTNPISALPAAILDLGLDVAGLANITYSKFIPTGDFYEDEKPMLYARAFNAVRSAGKFVVRGASKMATAVQAPFKLLTYSNCQKAT